MLRILCLALCGLLTGARADPGALLRLGMDILNHGEPRAGRGARSGLWARGWSWLLTTDCRPLNVPQSSTQTSGQGAVPTLHPTEGD